MIAVALKGLAGPQGPRPADGVRRRDRRHDGERDVRPHRHDPEGVRRHLHGVVRADRRGDRRQGDRQGLPERGRDGSRVAARARCGRCPRSRRPAARSRRTQSNHAEIFGRDGKAIGTDGAPQFGLGNDASLPQFSPLQLKTGQWPQGPQQVAIDADTAAGENFKVGDTVAVSTLGTKRRYEVTGIATLRRGRLARRRHDRDLGPPDRPDAAGQGRPLRRHLDRRQGRHVAGRARPRRPAAGPREPGGQGLRAAGRGGRQRDQRHRQRHPLLPAGLRRDRAVRGRVRDLQHPVDHRRPAHARVRDAADARGLAQAGHALGRDRGPGDRAAGLGDRALRRASGSPSC